VIALQLAAALHAIHRAGIVHRDLKPRNIMLVERPSQDDLVKVLDFGIAAIHEDEPGEDIELTGTRMVVGTPPYMSPEQTYMKADRERLELVLDGRSDLYSLGVILYEMLTGTRPFVGDAHELALAHRQEVPASLAGRVATDVPSGFCDLVIRLLAKAPDERPASAQQVLATLRALQSAGPARVSPGGRQQDVQDAATCIVDAVASHAQDAPTLTAPAVSLSTLATEAEEDIDYSSVRSSRTPMMVAALALCGVLAWVSWPSNSSPPAGEAPMPTPASSAEAAAGEVAAPAGASVRGVPESGAAHARSLSLMVTSVPPSAKVLLDGVVLGTTPLTTTLDAGAEQQHLLEIEREGYRLRQVPIAVAPHLAGKALVFNEVLEPAAETGASEAAEKPQHRAGKEATRPRKAKRRTSRPKKKKKRASKPATRDPWEDY